MSRISQVSLGSAGVSVSIVRVTYPGFGHGFPLGGKPCNIFCQSQRSLPVSLTIGPALLQMEAAWMCEQTPWKLEMLKKAFPGVPIFDNMLDLHRKLARNVVSGQYENVRSVQGAICGYPCKSVSAQNSDPKSIRDASSTSGAGFRSLMKFVDSQPDLQWVVFENVARFTHSRGQFDGEQPSQVQARELKKRGFFNFDFVLNASNFGLRQSRSRAWLLYVRSDALKVFHDTETQQSCVSILCSVLLYYCIILL